MAGVYLVSHFPEGEAKFKANFTELRGSGGGVLRPPRELLNLGTFTSGNSTKCHQTVCVQA